MSHDPPASNRACWLPAWRRSSGGWHRRWLALHYASNHTARLLERSLSFFSRRAKLVHHDRGFHPLVGRCKEPTRFITVDATHLHHDPFAAIDQLQVCRTKIDHEVAVRLAQANHRSGRDHVEHELGCSTGLHACRTGHNFGTNDWQDCDVYSR